MKRTRDDTAPIAHAIGRVLGVPPTGKFPGVMPVALRGHHLKDRTFWYASKDDGTRAMMMGHEGRWVLFGRSLEEMRSAPYEGAPFLLDGELMQDGSYRIFDCLVWRGENRTTLPLMKRLEGVSPPMGEIKVWRDKPQPPTSDSASDGIILVPTEGGYYDAPPLKWKAVHTVDFRVTRHGLAILGDFGRESVAVLGSEWHEHPDSTIVECEYRDGSWRALRARPDKTRPNSLVVFTDTLTAMFESQSIKLF